MFSASVTSAMISAGRKPKLPITTKPMVATTANEPSSKPKRPLPHSGNTIENTSTMPAGKARREERDQK